MSETAKLLIDNKAVLSKDLNYDDLILLYRQYIEKYKTVPSQRACNTKHNLPNVHIIKKILSFNGMIYSDFIRQFEDYNNRSALLINEQIEEKYNQFPLFINNTEYNIFGDIDVAHSDKKHNIYYINLIDNNGYKYRTTYNVIMSAVSNKIELQKFFKRNIFTYNNINNFCRIKNIDLYIDGTGLSVSGLAREKLPFIDSSGKVSMISWNQIQHYTFQYQQDYEYIKKYNWENRHMTKEKAIPIILKMQEDLNRPLLQTDFEGVVTSDSSIGIRIVWRLWGTFKNMVDELGLLKHDNYYKPNSNYYIPHEDILKYIGIVCDTVKDQGRNIITTKDFKNIVGIVDIRRIRNHCKLEGVDFYSIIESHGCKLQDSGNGMNHKFEDGERAVSQYEYDFSRFLRSNGLLYNKDYFRDVTYNTLDDRYSGGMNCDYKIIINNNIVFIELAGILCNKKHQEAYRNCTPINSKSKETYRQKLNLKREIFERNNLDYYILLPDEMNEETYKKIFSKYMKEVA